MEYKDSYAACERTYATVRIYPGDMPPDEVSNILKIRPTKVSLAGTKGGGRKSINGWFFSSEGKVDSRDSRRHIDYLLDEIEASERGILELQGVGVKIDICCFWVSSAGNGGPIISPKQMARLVRLNIDIWWDVWFSPQG